MNTNIFKLNAICIVLTIVVVISSCRKKHNITSNNNDNVFELLEKLKSPAQKFSGQAGEAWSISGIKGTRINFYPKSFRDNNGQIINSGTIDIELIETPKAKDMILNGVTTMVGKSRFLQSGGAINITATQNGNPVIVGERFGIDFKQDNASTDTMFVFQGWAGQQMSFTDGTGLVSWGESGSNGQAGTRVDTSSVINYYSFDSVLNFDWINCDRFRNDIGPKTNINIMLSGANPKLYGVIGFLVLPDINSVISIYQSNPDNLKYLSLGSSMKIPIGMKATFVVMAKIDSEYYFARKDAGSLVNNHSESMVLKKKSITEIISEINSL